MIKLYSIFWKQKYTLTFKNIVQEILSIMTGLGDYKKDNVINNIIFCWGWKN